MKIDERELFKRVMTDFIPEEDPMLAMLKWMTEQLMEVEAANKVGANKNEYSVERKTHFSGYRPRRFDTRVGTMYLMIPKLRKGFFITEKKRAEQALMSVIQEAYINGVSTRKVEGVLGELDIELSYATVSNLSYELDELITEFRTSPLRNYYPYLYVNTLYLKVFNGSRFISQAVMVAIGVNEDGY